MDTSALKKFAQEARRQLLEQVAARMEQVLQVDSIEVREKAAAVAQLREQIAESSKEAVIDSVAYTWFNRFCALRYMDVNHYTRMGIVSPQDGYTQPEILAEAKQGIIDESFIVDQAQVIGLLNGQIPSANPQGEAYRLLLVGASRAYHAQMPFLFPEIEDYTALLMPEDLLSENSILHSMRQALDEAACQDVEVIGWLYQFYISERKDEVIGSKNKIQPEDIPAATQLFTPHWIVRYLVENSLGRLWMLNNPESKLVEHMEYYIQPEEPESDFLRVESPEELKICDPACGSGHMLTYAFDLLYAIYEEQGYDPVQIPQLILEKNLYGIDIDQRAGHLAAFALTMKARQRDRRFFRRGVEPNICVLRNVSFEAKEIDDYMQAVGRDLFTQDLWLTLRQFEQTENFGSLIRPALKDVYSIREQLGEQGIFENLFLHNTNLKVEQVLEMVEYLSSNYQVVVTNPPYMGGRTMNYNLKEFAKDHYPDSKSDLFALFIERNSELVRSGGLVAMITMQSWMFLSSFKKIRKKLLDHNCIVAMAHLGARAFDTISGEVVSTTAFVLQRLKNKLSKGVYLRLIEGKNEAEKSAALRSKINESHIYLASSIDFEKIPDAPIAYWVSNKVRDLFDLEPSLKSIASPRQGMATTNNDLFLRQWFETSFRKIGLGLTKEEAVESRKKWFPINKGGSYRRWYGNQDFIVNYENEGKTICDYIDNTPGVRVKSSGRVINRQYYFREGLTWSTISSNNFSMRYSPTGFIFETKGAMCFCNDQTDLFSILGYLNSKIVSHLLLAVSPTLDFHEGPLGRLPLKKSQKTHNVTTVQLVKNAISIAEEDWNNLETSWNFSVLPLLNYENQHEPIKQTYSTLRSAWKEKVLEAQRLEERINRIFIEAYALQDELTPDVKLGKITLTCNPYYRYGSNKNEKELEALLLADTMKEFISYAVGCMFGRYSLDKPGLILANEGETLRDYLKQVPEPTFPADNDNVIPVLDEGWFDDDIVERFKRFLRVTFGDEHYEENLAFLENGIGKDIRGYFLKDFYKEHLKMYKKRPIYWLFSSPNGSFNALIYMHRYRPDTVSIILNDYLRQYREKISAHKAHLQAVERDPNASQGEKTKALREIDKIDKVLAELREYEDEVLYPLAAQQIQIDLDDGVKVNYPKFGKALKRVSGLSS